jgi:hypothetical protein
VNKLGFSQENKDLFDDFHVDLSEYTTNVHRTRKQGSSSFILDDPEELLRKPKPPRGKASTFSKVSQQTASTP